MIPFLKFHLPLRLIHRVWTANSLIVLQDHYQKSHNASIAKSPPMAKDSVVSKTTAMVAASEESPLLQANSEVSRIHHPSLDTSNGTFSGDDGDSTTDVLRRSSHASTEDDDDDVDDEPLPRRQIFLLCYCRMVEPIAFFSIFPYINMMIQRTGGVREEDVGFYSGLIVGYFSHLRCLHFITERSSRCFSGKRRC